MAIVKNNYVKRGSGQRDRVKASLRYIAHRPGKDNKRMYRELFGYDGVMEKDQAYRMFDAAEKGTNFFRLVISTDPKREDTYKDLQMRAIAIKTIQHLEEKLHLEGKIQFVAAIHNDHTNIRHIHAIVLVPKKLSREEFKVFQDLKHAATAEALRQRQQLDQVREAQRQQTGRYLRYNKVDFEPATAPPDIMACTECGTIQPAEALSR
ncbi:MAG TPA: hypothetical protein VM715_16620, partial [Candidatus Acidoferrum sp.]|nr:hypothetical protein [Candidatus Acidoferrum sp.]